MFERDDRVVQGGRALVDIDPAAKPQALLGSVLSAMVQLTAFSVPAFSSMPAPTFAGRVARDGAVGDIQRTAVFVEPAAGAGRASNMVLLRLR